MGFKCGIIGLPNVGKSTIFNALTRASNAASANYPFCTIEPNTGKVAVPDTRLNEINSIISSEKIIPAFMEFIDIAGLVKGASKGEGLGNQFLGHIRQTDALAHIVRCFSSEDTTHVEGSVDPLRDIDIIETELIFADNETISNNIKRIEKQKKINQKTATDILHMLNNLYSHTQKLKPARTFDLNPYKQNFEIMQAYKALHLMSAKPILYICNVNDDYSSSSKDQKFVEAVQKKAALENTEVIILSGKLEAELSELSDTEQKELLKELELNEAGLNKMIRSGYSLLNLHTYFTAGPKEIRAWTIPKKAKAPQAAGVIHSDFERGFICAETYTFQDLMNTKDSAKLKEKGLIRTEGKDYIVKDGDIIEFKFNV